MTFKPMTYLVSFTLFVLLFMALGGYVGYGKLADHFLTQGYLDATAIQVRVLSDPKGPMLRWEDQVLLPNGATATILATNRSLPIMIEFPGQPGMASSPVVQIPLAPNERTQDVRVDQAHRYLYARVFAASQTKAQEITWLYKVDLRNRKLARHTAANPILLPAPFRP